MSDTSNAVPGWHACAAIVQQADPERFHATMAAPVAARAVLFPIYAFNVEVARAPWVTAEPLIAQMRLQWWRDALEEIVAGGEVRRHEVVTPLAEVLDPEGARLLDDLVVARYADIEKAPFEDAAALLSYLEATGGGVMAAAARALGDRHGDTARKTGTAQGIAAYLRAVPELEARGKLPLPDGRPEAVRALAEDGLALLREAARSRSAMDRKARPALLPGALSKPILRRVVAQPERVKDGAVMPPEAVARWRRLWASLV
jgi:phytoene/squalene synthetase